MKKTNDKKRTRKPQYQNIQTKDLEDGMTTLGMTLDLGMLNGLRGQAVFE